MIPKPRKNVSVRVVPLPTLLTPGDLRGRVVVVFDVFRATTTMAAALAAGVSSIRIVANIEQARRLARQHPAALLAGEQNCLRPRGFDLGNSPGALTAKKHRGETMIMCTTNGTRAVLAARRASRILVGSLVNARATARALAADGREITLLCAGTRGELAMEDLCGAGAVIAHLAKMMPISLDGDAAILSRQLFVQHRRGLLKLLRASRGGRNIVNANLSEDLSFASDLDRLEESESLEVVGQVLSGPLRVVRL